MLGTNHPDTRDGNYCHKHGVKFLDGACPQCLEDERRKAQLGKKPPRPGKEKKPVSLTTTLVVLIVVGFLVIALSG